MSYTAEDILAYWNKIKPKEKSRARQILDVRNYVLAVLHYKFKINETQLERLMGIDRSTINHAKKHPYNLIKVSEATFMRHTLIVRELYPYDFPPVDKNDTMYNQFNRQYSYTINFDKQTYNKIKKYCNIKDLDPRVALRGLVQKALALWEE